MRILKSTVNNRVLSMGPVVKTLLTESTTTSSVDE